MSSKKQSMYFIVMISLFYHWIYFWWLISFSSNIFSENLEKRSLILLYYKMPRYLYQFSSRSVILSTADISTHSDNTTFPIFNTSTPLFFIPNFIPISLLKICTLHAFFLQRSLINQQTETQTFSIFEGVP